MGDVAAQRKKLARDVGTWPWSISCCPPNFVEYPCGNFQALFSCCQAGWTHCTGRRSLGARMWWVEHCYSPTHWFLEDLVLFVEVGDVVVAEFANGRLFNPGAYGGVTCNWCVQAIIDFKFVCQLMMFGLYSHHFDGNFLDGVIIDADVTSVARITCYGSSATLA